MGKLSFFEAAKAQRTKVKRFTETDARKMQGKFGRSQENPSIDNRTTKMKPEMQILNSVCLHIHFFH